MLDERTTTIPNNCDATDPRTLAFNHPDDVLHDRRLTAEEKRATLAAWASDAHAVPNVPALRQLPSGAIVNVDTVLTALRSLDGTEQARPSGLRLRGGWTRPRLPIRVDWRRGRRRNDGDDDPPPCPAAAAMPPGLRREPRRDLQIACQLMAAA
jgi:hypothetical protein